MPPGSITARYWENRAPIRGAITMMPCDRSQPGRSEVTKLSGAIRACDRRLGCGSCRKAPFRRLPRSGHPGTVCSTDSMRPARRSRKCISTSSPTVDVVEQNPFVRMMAHAAGAAQKQHRHRRHRGHHAGIVARAADQAMWVVAGRRQVPRRANRSEADRPGPRRGALAPPPRNSTPRRSASAVARANSSSTAATRT